MSGFDDNPSVEVPEDIPQDKPAYEILTDDTYSFKEFIHTHIDESSLTSSIPDAMKILLEAQIDAYIDNLAATVGVAPEELWFRRVTYLYPSIDQYGSQRSLSAMALWLGTKADKEWTDISPDRICLMEHFTIASDAECPSVGYPFEAFINGNSLVLMPDYIGYGATADMVHPYMNHELCAVNSIDALEAGYKLFEELSIAEMTPGWTTSVAGASQGGGNALAVFDAFGESKVTLEPSLLMDHTLNCVYWMLDVMSHSENTTRKF